MGLQISEFNKKLLICSLGIIILTYGICLLYKKKIVREGMPVAAMPAALMAQMSGLSSYLMSLPMKMKHHLLTMAGIRETESTVIAKDEANTAEITAQATSNATKASAQLNNVNMKLSKIINQAVSKLITRMNQLYNKSINKMQDDKFELEQEAKKNAKAQLWRNRKHMAYVTAKGALDVEVTAASYAGMLSILSKIYDWALPFLQCGWYWFTNLRHCFLWYFLDTMGEILYLPFSFLIWVFPILEQPADLFWNTLDNIDCIVYDMIGYHFLHYSPAITQQCFMCNPVGFPQDLEAAGKALIKEYPIGIKDVAHFFSDAVLTSFDNQAKMAQALAGF